MMIGLSLLASVWMTVLFATLCVSATVVVVTTVPPIIGEIVATAQRGTALGACVAISALGGLIAPFLFGKVVDAAAHSATGYQNPFLISGLLTAGAAILVRLFTHPSRDRESLERLASSTVS